jgi:hypothetical protein
MEKTEMSTKRGTSKHRIELLLAAVLLTTYGVTNAQTKVPPPPYQIAGSNHVFVGVIWEEAAIRKALPPGITPVKEMTGAINIYQTGKSYAFGPYQSSYFYVDIEGFDSADGTKGRWMLAGVYGPDEKMPVALREYYGFPVRLGASRSEATNLGRRAIGAINGQDFVTVEVKSFPSECQAVAGTLTYPGISSMTEKLVVNEIPYVGENCKAEPISVNITAPAGDPLAAFPIAKVVWAAEFKNASFSFSPPKIVGK